MAAEYDSSGNLLKEYHFHPQETWMTDPLFQRAADNQIYYYQNDHLGTPQRLIKSNGAIVWRATYTAFGEAAVDPDSSIENNLRFLGQYYDQETGLHHNYYRDYDPHTGRYIQEDPIGLRGGLNVYGYAYQNSIKNFDPDGQLAMFVPVVWYAATTAFTAYRALKLLNTAYNIAQMAEEVAEEANADSEGDNESQAECPPETPEINKQLQDAHKPGTPQNKNENKQRKEKGRDPPST